MTAVLWAAMVPLLLMVFVIQNTQNRDGAAIRIKLDEIVRAMKGAHNGLLDLEELNDSEIEAFRKRYLQLAEKARDNSRRARSDTGTPKIRLPSEVAAGDCAAGLSVRVCGSFTLSPPVNSANDSATTLRAEPARSTMRRRGAQVWPLRCRGEC